MPTNTTNPPLSQLLHQDHITLTAHLAATGTDANNWAHREYHGTLHYADRTLNHQWKEGSTHGPHPTALSVIAPAIRHAATALAADNYTDWASNFTLDPEQWMPPTTYEACLRLAEDLTRLLGPERFDRYAHHAEHDD